MVKLNLRALFLGMIFLGVSVLGAQSIDLIYVEKKSQGFELRWEEVPINVITSSEYGASIEARIKKLINDIGINNFQQVSRISLRISEKGDSLVIFYQAFPLDNQDVKDNLVQGIVFQVNNDGNLVYDFSVLKDDLLVRINGIYDGMDEVKKKISSALEDPAYYIQKNDPDYILNQILQNRKKLEETNLALEKTNLELEKANSDLKRFMEVWLAYQNASFIKGPRLVDGEIREEIVRLRKENSEITVKEIENSMKEKGIKVDKKTIQLVLALDLLEFLK